MEALEASGKALCRSNLVKIMESQEFKIAMAGTLSFANGMRAGVQDFALTQVYDDVANSLVHTAKSKTVHGLMSIEEYRGLLK